MSKSGPNNRARSLDQWVSRSSFYTVSCDVAWVCRAGERWPEAITLNGGALYAPANSTIMAIGAAPVASISPNNMQAMIDVADLLTWYSGLFKLRAAERVGAVIEKMIERGLGMTSPDGPVVSITKSNLGTLCRLSREEVGRIINYDGRWGRCPDIPHGITTLGGSNEAITKRTATDRRVHSSRVLHI